MNLLHKSFYKFHENRIKKEEASVDADLDPEDGVISDIFCKIVTKIRSLFSLHKEEKKENEESNEHLLDHKKPNFLKVIDNFFHTIFDSTKKTQWQVQGEAQIMQLDKTFSRTEGLLQQKNLQTLAEETLKLRLIFSFLNQKWCR